MGQQEIIQVLSNRSLMGNPEYITIKELKKELVKLGMGPLSTAVKKTRENCLQLWAYGVLDLETGLKGIFGKNLKFKIKKEYVLKCAEPKNQNQNVAVANK